MNVQILHFCINWFKLLGLIKIDIIANKAVKSCTEKEEGEEKFKFMEVYVKKNISNYPSKKKIF